MSDLEGFPESFVREIGVMLNCGVVLRIATL